MNTIRKQVFPQRALALFAAIVACIMAIALGANLAYAATDSENGSIGVPGDTNLRAQYMGFTTATTAPTATPSNSLSRYEVYSTYLFFSIGTDYNLINYNMYMDIWPANKPEAKKVWSFDTYVKTYEVKGLKPNTKYKARLYYGLNTSIIGPKSKTVTFRTGPNKKPALKSVSVKAINVKKIVKPHVSPYDGYVYKTIKDVYYKYKIKTTVTFRKAPKSKYVNYVMINGKNIKLKKGKKTYTLTTKTQTSLYNPRKQSYTAYVATFQNKTWKGYSKLYQKNKKIK